MRNNFKIFKHHLNDYHVLCSEDTKRNKIQYPCLHRHQSMDDRGEGLGPIRIGFPEVSGCKSTVVMVLIEMWRMGKWGRDGVGVWD